MSNTNNPQKKVNILTSAGLSASLMGVYYSYLADYVPDFSQEQSAVGVAVLAVAWVWFKFLDKDRDGILDFIDPYVGDYDSLGGAELESASVDETVGFPGADFDDDVTDAEPDELDYVLGQIRQLLDTLVR